MEKAYTNIPKEKFEFAYKGEYLHDEKLQTKSRSYFQDAFIRFKKNKSSVVAAGIICLLVIFAIVAPIISPYSVYDRNTTYQKLPPFIPSIAAKEWGIFDGATVRDGQNQVQMDNFAAIAQETGFDPLIKIEGITSVTEKYRGQDRTVDYYTVSVNAYYSIGVKKMTLSYEEYARIQAWQDENQIQVILPWVEKSDAYANISSDHKDKIPEDKELPDNVWYQYKYDKASKKFVADKNADGTFKPAYCTNPKIAGETKDTPAIPYTSNMRIEGDDGSYIYCKAVSGSVKCRLNYYNYYRFLNDGQEPTYIFGTDNYGGDLFCAIGMGARFSLIFAVIVAAINLTIGAFYGAIQGYYGGVIDLVMDRISDILSGVPFIVVATLFKLHLAQKVGPVVSFLFAFVMTGWIGMAALTRKQFYRFKNQEYIMAARTLGASDRRLMFKHIFPNAIGTMITSCALVIPGVISSETSLTYLGIIDLSEITGTSIGTLMSAGQNSMSAAPHAMLYPALFISLLLISFNLFGNGLRDAFNPSTKGEE